MNIRRPRFLSLLLFPMHTVLSLWRRRQRTSQQGDGPRSSDRFEKFTERTRKVFALSQEEARHFNHNYIGTEHLLLGLVREEDGVAARVLANLGVSLPKVRSAVEFIIGRGDGIVVGDPGLTPRAKRVIELAMDEARRLNSHYIGTEHLLLGLVREGEGIAAGVLESFGVSLEEVRQQVMQVVTQSSSFRQVSPPPRTRPPASFPMNVEAGAFVYGLTMPPRFVIELQELAWKTNRSVDDLIIEAITRTWLQGSDTPATDSPNAGQEPPTDAQPKPPEAE